MKDKLIKIGYTSMICTVLGLGKIMYSASIVENSLPLVTTYKNLITQKITLESKKFDVQHQEEYNIVAREYNSLCARVSAIESQPEFQSERNVSKQAAEGNLRWGLIPLSVWLASWYLDYKLTKRAKSLESHCESGKCKG